MAELFFHFGTKDKQQIFRQNKKTKCLENFLTND